MQISEYKSQVVVVQFKERLDSSYVGKVRETLKALTRSGRDKFVVDLKDVYFIDSQGLGILVSLLRASRGNDGTVHFVNSSHEGPRQLFSVTNLDEVFEMYDTLDQALQGFNL